MKMKSEDILESRQLSRLLFLKVHTTGLEMTDNIVRISLIAAEGNSSTEEKNIIISLPDNVVMSDEICEMNKLTNDDVRKHGRDFTEVYSSELLPFLKDGYTIVTYNNFDLKMFYSMCARNSIEMELNESKSIELMSDFKRSIKYDFWSVLEHVTRKCDDMLDFTLDDSLITATHIMTLFYIMCSRNFDFELMDKSISLDGSIAFSDDIVERQFIEDGSVVTKMVRPIIFTRGKYANVSVREVFERDMNYINYIIRNRMCDLLTIKTLSIEYNIYKETISKFFINPLNK